MLVGLANLEEFKQTDQKNYSLWHRSTIIDQWLLVIPNMLQFKRSEKTEIYCEHKILPCSNDWVFQLQNGCVVAPLTLHDFICLVDLNKL